MIPSTSLLPAPDFDISAANADFSSSAPPTRLVLGSSASTFADSNHSPYNDDLLTPPLTNPSLDEPPFRPAESDRTSLSMKRRHESSRQRRRRHNRACVSSGDVDQTALPWSESPRHIRSLSRSRSVPNLYGGEVGEQGTLWFATNSSHKTRLASRSSSHPRRWTMPGKAAPTRVLTSIPPSGKLTEHGETQVDDEGGSSQGAVSVETPAMITLQRAASCRPHRTSLRPEAYTSFPTPTFSGTRSGLATTFFGDGWQRSDNICIRASVKSMSIASHNHSPPPHSDRASVDHGNVRPSYSTTAGLVRTDVLLDPVIQGHTDDIQPASRVRRCSTKYVSGASVYEVIWDENVSTSSSSTSHTISEEHTKQLSMQNNGIFQERRQSVAMDKLEKQLTKGIQQSRKTPSSSKDHGIVKEAPALRRSTGGNAFYNRLNLQQVGYDAEEELRSLPRSRASTTSKQKLKGPDMEVHLLTITGDEPPMRYTDLFPPLSSDCASLDSSNDALLINPWRSSWETGSAAVIPTSAKKADDKMSSPQRKGSMIGLSTGVRKKSAERHRLKLGQQAGFTRRKRSKLVEDERRPLLGQFNEWSDKPFSQRYC